MIYKELKKEIVNWLLDNENVWQRINSCYEAFRPYIYDSNGGYLINGKEVGEFIERADKLLYSNN